MLWDLLAIFQKFCYKEEACGYAKVIHKKKERKSIGKNGQVSEISKTIGTHMSAWKKREKKRRIR
jgi:hypothetical protein